ncbi:30S ribosomal protein S15 [Nanoarchaeota archaeon]|nr:MAG: 30S ribosomal protein S15 [Nanoarchaeota archaeon]
MGMGKRTGKSGSKRVVRDKPPVWVKYTPEEVEKLVLSLAEQGYQTSMIGTILRDSYGIPSIRLVTGKKILQILKEHGKSPKIPEDLYNMMKKAVIIHKHLRTNPKDYVSKRGLLILESRIRKLVRYYHRKGVLPKTWKYDPEKAEILVNL